MKKLLCLLLMAALVLTVGCDRKDPTESTTEPSQTGSAEPSSSETNGTEEASTPENTTEALPSDEQTEATSEDDTEESFSVPEAEQVVQQSVKGCFYGKNTGTDKTFTGLEPLPPADFGNVSFENTKGLSTATVSHSYGVASEEKPHSISVNYQKFFDDNGYNAVCYDASAEEKILYLTFDCGYENGYTAKILDTLRDKDVPAAFFCTLPQMRQNTDLIARMINEGHIVGNHSVTHPDFSGLTRKQMYEEVKEFDDYLRAHFGYSSLYFRYPQGKYSESSLDLLNQMGYTCVFWSLAYADWDLDNQKGAAYALETVMSRLHPGAVILLHAVSPDNANALADIIDGAREKGYTFRALSDYGA